MVTMTETRVGYAALAELRTIYLEYIKAHIVDRKYVGESWILMAYSDLNRLLEYREKNAGGNL